MTGTTTTTRTLLAAAPPTPSADREISASRYQSNETDHIDGFGRSRLQWPMLSLESQEELVASHQWCQTAQEAIDTGAVRGSGRGRVAAEIRRREHHLEYLMGAVFRLVRKIVDERMAQHNLHSSLRDDLLTEAYAIAVRSAHQYDPSFTGSFPGYVADRIRKEIGGIGRRLRVSGNAPESWHRIAAVAGGIESRLASTLGREPTDAEFTAALEQGCEEWALEKLDDAQRLLPKEQQRELVRKKLVKQGLARGVADFNEVRTAMGREISLDAPVSGDPDGSSLGELRPGGEDSATLSLVELDSKRLLRVLQDALADLEPELATRVIDRLDGVETDGRSVAAIALRSTRVRIAAAHTQWASLSHTLDQQFRSSPTDAFLAEPLDA
jgi:hypothetical protein